MNKKSTRESLQDRLALKAGIVYVIAELLTRGISFFMTPVFTRILPTEVFGRAKVFESWVYIIAPIVSISVYQSVARAKFDFEKKYNAYVSSMLGLMGGISAIAIGMTIILREQIVSFLGFSYDLVILMLVYCFAYNCIQCVQMYERQNLNYLSNVLLTFFAVVPGVVISVIAVLNAGSGIEAERLLEIRLYSFFSPTIVVAIITIVISLYRGRTILNREYWKYGITYSLPMMLTAISTQILYQSDKIMVDYFCSGTITAIFSLGATIGYIMDILIHTIDNAWRPWLFEKLNLENFEPIQYVWRILFIGLGMLTIIITIFAPELIWFLGGTSYRDAIWLIMPIVYGNLINFIVLAYTGIEQFYKKTKISGYVSCIVAIFNLVLNYIGIKQFGYVAAAYTTVASFALAAIIHGVAVKRIGKSNILLEKQTIFTLLVTLMVCIFGTFLYGYSFGVRILYAFIWVVCLGLYFRKNITYLINLLRGNK